MNECELDLLMEEVLAEMANPSVNAELIDKLQPGEQKMTANNVLVFGSIGKTGGLGMSPRSLTTAAVLNIAAAMLLFVFVARARQIAPPAFEQVAVLEAPPWPPTTPPQLHSMGGGGGNPGEAPATKGNPPRFAPQIAPLTTPPQIAPKLAVEPTVDVDPSMTMSRNEVPNFGMPNSPLVGMSLGNGKGSGLGGGSGAGIGAGSGGNMGGGLRRIGGGVSAPVVLFAPEPEFSEEARKAKVSGNVLVYLQVDTSGHPTHVRVLRGIGLGLDEKALAAVRAYKFKPAMENGKPVAVEMNVEVNFQIF